MCAFEVCPLGTVWGVSRPDGTLGAVHGWQVCDCNPKKRSTRLFVPKSSRQPNKRAVINCTLLVSSMNAGGHRKGGYYNYPAIQFETWNGDSEHLPGAGGRLTFWHWEHLNIRMPISVS